MIDKMKTKMSGLFSKKKKSPEYSDEGQEDIAVQPREIHDNVAGHEDHITPNDVFHDPVDLDLSVETMNHIRMGKTDLAVSLLWQSDEDGVSVKEKAKLVSTSNAQVDLYVKIKSVRMSGYGSTEEGLKSGMIAGATLFSEKVMGRNWIAVFPIGNEMSQRKGYWLVSYRDGVVFEDNLYLTEGDAQSQFLNSVSAPDWDRIICPSSWGVKNSQDVPLESILKPKAKGLKLKDVNPIRANLVKIILICMVLGGSGAGYYAWIVYQERAAEAERQLAEARSSIVRIDPKDYPWANAPHVSTFIEACQEGMSDLIVVVPGWVPQALQCSLNRNNASISTSWRREGGRIPTLRAAFPDQIARTVNLDAQGNSASTSVSKPVTTREDILDRNPWVGNVIGTVVRERFQTLGLQATLRPRIERVSPRQRQEMTKPIYNRHDMSFKTDVAIDEYGILLSDIPALLPESLVYDPISGEWSLTVSAYHPPILPEPKPASSRFSFQ